MLDEQDSGSDLQHCGNNTRNRESYDQNGAVATENPDSYEAPCSIFFF